MAANRGKQKKTLKLDCEWGSCQESFDRMESFGKRAEDHLVALKAEEEDEAEVSHDKCPLCDMTCPSPSSLRSHIEFLHSNERPYSCDFCEHRCKNLVDLRKHLDSHSSESAFHCEVPGCSSTAQAAWTMKFHHKKEHEVRGSGATPNKTFPLFLPRCKKQNGNSTVSRGSSSGNRLSSSGNRLN
ncbi:zinc finger autosomal protein-like isoform 2-T2 [Pholidichthys leucotaenia]